MGSEFYRQNIPFADQRAVNAVLAAINPIFSRVDQGVFSGKGRIARAVVEFGLDGKDLACGLFGRNFRVPADLGQALFLTRYLALSVLGARPPAVTVGVAGDVALALEILVLVVVRGV